MNIPWLYNTNTVYLSTSVLFDIIDKPMTIKPRTKNGYGDFGSLSTSYHKGRRGFPNEVIEYIFSKLTSKHPRVLDMGCGTGIATEQLHEKGAEVIGTDIDTKMIQEAKLHNPYSIEYFVTPASQQPFEDKIFDAVTIFSAFHWFANKEAADEIKRVLKTGGFFFVINKNETGDFKKGYRDVLKKFIPQELPDIKKTYDPKHILEKNGLQNIEVKIFQTSEYFSVEQAVMYLQTVSMWNLVPEDKKNTALRATQDYFKKIAGQDGKVERKLGVSVVSGKH